MKFFHRIICWLKRRHFVRCDLDSHDDDLICIHCGKKYPAATTVETDGSINI